MILIQQEEESKNDKINDQQNSRNMVLVETPFISLYISKIEVSFIDKLMRELCLLVVKNINLIYKKQESVTFTIESFRLNDMYADPVSPVVFCEKSPRFLSVEIKTKLPLKMHSFESIDIDISPLHFFVDIVFISDILYAICEIIIDSKIANKNKDNNQLVTENFTRYTFYSIKQINISPICIDFSKINSFNRKNRLPCPKILPSYFLRFKYLAIPISMNKFFDKYQNKNIHTPLDNFITSIYENYSNQVSLSDLRSLTIFKDSSAIKISSESFEDLIENTDENDLKLLKKKGLITSPERLPRAFPMNRIRSVLSDAENNKKFCQFSMAQHTFQKSNQNECLLLLISSVNDSNVKKSFLAIFNHFVVHLSEDLQFVLFTLKVTSSLKIDIKRNAVMFADRKKKIDFICENEEESKLIVTIVKSIADKIQLLES